MSHLLPFFQWCETTWLGSGIRASLWLFPVIEATHLVAFAVLGGTVLVLDLRLLGIVFRAQPVAALDRSIRPWFRTSLAALLVTGTLLFLSESVKCYYSIPFRIKIASLLVAMAFAATVHKRVAAADEGRIGPVWGRLAAIVSLALWSTVAWGGRWIGFSG